ncbi:mannan-binding lectin [Nostoc sp. FACHB-152]|uniref:mannan-binding lectin n=1 Tax=unclassified Nostoc TaxID=2593658 RepID=UPI0016896F01|nr:MULTISPECIES: mannan-binding lectin [unclassified Nostoc]MBD2448364.1 mannan-binding lectin [Nostoc sp. FACHB-152]MBD2469723.1 mannan-binding lectin [Nostoc sp. FACHB-145]
MKNKFLLSLGAVIIGSSAVFGFSSQASALDVKAGPIWNNDDAQIKCPVAAQVYNAQWNGQWVTTVFGQMSVCGTNLTFLPTIALPGDVNAGPIWNNDDAQLKCPVAAAAANGVWNGNWTTTIPGIMSVCGVNRP